MKLTVKEIHKSQAVYKMLVELDEQIIKLDKRAMQLADHSQTVDLAFTFEDLKAKKILDEDGSLLADNYLRFSMLSILSPTPREEKKDTLELTLTDTEALSVIGFLINVKKQQRQVLIAELVALGFDF